jgi:hypothetical protein
MARLYAQPYNLDAVGFYFESFEEYTDKVKNLKDRFGNPVEEFEIQYMEGENGELFRACNINQTLLEVWFDEIEFLQDEDKVRLFFLNGNNICKDLRDALDNYHKISFYVGTSVETAIEVFDAIHLYRVPEDLQTYIDYEKYANALKCNGDFVEFKYNDTTYTCTNANSL